MHRFLGLGFTVAVALGIGWGAMAHAATQVECHALFRQADDNSDGLLDQPELLRIPSFMAGGKLEKIAPIALKPQDFEEKCMRNRFWSEAAQQ